MELSLEQASVVASALDLLSQLGTGKVTDLDVMIRLGLIPSKNVCDIDQLETISNTINLLQTQLGFERGESLGIYNENTPTPVKQAYEIKKVLNHQLLNHQQDKNNIDSFGLIVRATHDDLPIITVTPLTVTMAFDYVMNKTKCEKQHINQFEFPQRLSNGSELEKIQVLGFQTPNGHFTYDSVRGWKTWDGVIPPL